jgi:hypothetical protein
VNDDLDLRYTISHRPRPGTTTVETLPYSGWLRPPGKLFVLLKN